MQNLAPLNSQTFFCRTCGIGPEGSCPGVHVDREVKRPGSRFRHYAILLALAFAFAALALGVFVYGRM
jgi:hypothetical protein